MARQGRYVYRREYIEVCAAFVWIAEDTTGAIYLPIRQACRALRIDSPSQVKVIKGDSRLSPALRAIPMPTDAGQGMHESQCLPAREFAWWLALIDPDNCKAEARETLLERYYALRDFATRVMFRRDGEGAPAPAAVAARAALSGELHIRCEVCGAPHCIVIDATGVHVRVGIEAE